MKRVCAILMVLLTVCGSSLSLIGCDAENTENRTMRACWVASIGNLDFPSASGLGAEALRAEIDSIVKNCSAMGLNTIFFQVRPCGDALYASSIFPWSAYLTGKQGTAPQGGFDPLPYFISRAHSAGIELHAWINPYRIGTGEGAWDQLSADNPAVLHPEYTVKTASGVFYNPGLPAVRRLIVQGVAELVRNYEIDGIHFDDYFYPYDMQGFDDSTAFQQYGESLSLEDFRRSAVNQLVESVHTTVKTINPAVSFGISPFGIWANRTEMPEGSDTSGMSSYSEIFSDSKAWVEHHWVDYICPQLYWSFDHPAAPYGVLADWWGALCTKNNVRFCAGLAAYKVGGDEAGWEDPDILNREIRYAEKNRSYGGFALFRYGVLVENQLHIAQSTSLKQVSAAAIKPTAAVHTLSVQTPQNGATIWGSAVSVSGAAPPGTPVTVNGITASSNASGLFSAYVPLSAGRNTITVRAGSAVRTLRVTRGQSSAEALSGIKKGSAYPMGEVHAGSGSSVVFSVSAEKGASVSLVHDLFELPLQPDESGTVYSSEWTVPAFLTADKQVLEGFYYRAVCGEKTVTAETDLTLHLYGVGYERRGELKTKTYQFDQSRGGSQMDHDPLPEGAPVTVIGAQGERLLLNNGYWIERDSFTEEQTPVPEPMGRVYETVTISAKNSFSYHTYYEDEAVYLEIGAGRQANPEITADRGISLSCMQEEAACKLKISYQNGAVGGYVLVPQRNKLTVYLHALPQELSGSTIVLDPGHGGSDSGALSPGGEAFPTESELNLALALHLKNSLEEAGANVVLLRGGDEDITLAERARLAESIAPDLFISIHHNAVDETADFNRASGGLVLYSAPLSTRLAEDLAGTLRAGWDASAAPHRQSLYVCRSTAYPAVLIETGFLCNPAEYEILCSADNMKKIAKNITDELSRHLS